MNKIFFLSREVILGRSVTRAFLNLRLSKEVFTGKSIDIGGGSNINYLSFVRKEHDFEYSNVEVKVGHVDIDFETDRLPAEDGIYDTVLCLNVMEHIYNFNHFASELVRITKPKTGKLIGFVPFLMWYHPDKSDYFRYTHESLEKIFINAGAKNIHIEEIGGGPFIAAAHMILSTLPRFIRVPVFLLFLGLDKCYQIIKGKRSRTHQLGYYFYVTHD